VTAAEVIDTHVHVSEPDDGRFPRSGLFPDAPSFTAPVEDLLTKMETAGVDRAVLIQPSIYGFDHSYLMHCLAEYPGRFAGIVLGDHHDPAFLDELEALASKGPLRGIRFAPLISPDRGWFEPSIEPLAAAAARLDLTINLLITPNWFSVADQWIERHPELTIVIDHLGRPDLAETSRESAATELLRLARHDNVHVKLSALPELSAVAYPHQDVWAAVRATVDAFGADRLLWGSDYPFTAVGGTYADSLTVLDQILPDLPAADRQSIVAGTARRLYRLPGE
jgi:predicted TIM-barrel fold metal-dependent hydrolase